MANIQRIHARQILDSRGNPTVEVDVQLSDGSFGRASVPSGASTGTHEALELRDGDKEDFFGKSVHQAVDHINDEIAGFLEKNDPFDQATIDHEMVSRDATKDAGRLGANAILGVSLAISKAAALSLQEPYYAYIRRVYQSLGGHPEPAFQLPRPMFNVMNGGAHTDWQSTDVQEFMIIPVKEDTFAEQLRWCTEIYHTLEKVLEEKGYSTMVGDEGGFAPKLKNDEEALALIMAAITNAGYQPGEDIAIGIDAAASEWYKDGIYKMPVQQHELSTQELISTWQNWMEKYPLISLEDGLAEDDWTGWQQLNKTLGSQLQLVGDDLLVTNLERIQKAIKERSCNALLMKVNQIGTLTESLLAIKEAKAAGWNVIVSHRSGETEDTSIADIVVGTSAGQIKAGAPARTERLAKYNQLLRIEEELLAKQR